MSGMPSSPARSSPTLATEAPSRSSGVSLVAPYVCRCLAERRLQHPDSEVFGSLLEGTLLFADISGFTTLSEQLGRQGNEGSEELTFLLNDYFEEMVEIVAGHGGDVLQFGGDSLLAVFGAVEAAGDAGLPVPAASRGAAPAAAGALQAVRCGLDMQAAMRRFEQLVTSAGAFRLSMSIAVHRGPFLLASAGAWAGQVQQVVMGGTLNRLAEVESAAAPGEVLVTSETAGLLEDRVLCDGLRNGCVPLLGLTRGNDVPSGTARRLRFDGAGAGWFDQVDTAAAAAEELLRPYLIPAVYRRLVGDPAGLGYEGEHRFIATMFVHFAGLGELLRSCEQGRTAEAVSFLDAYLAAMTQVIVEHGGALARVSADVRGDKLLVLFGAPLAVEHPEERALECALAMNRRLDELHAGAALAIEQRIGISSGSAFCGNVGSRRRREYTVIADPVNTAARLMLQARPAEILVSGSVSATALQSFDLERCGPLQLKGKRQSVDVYRLVSAGQRGPVRPQPTRPLIGRAAELRDFRQIVERVLGGSGQLLTVCGEAGVGKTRLLEEFVADGRQAGLTSFRGECLAFGQSVPGHAWAGLLRDLAGIAPQDAAGVAHAKLVARLARTNPELARWSPLLGDLLGMPLRDSDHTADLTPRQRKEKLFAVLIELLTAQARECPTLLALENLQWIDPLSRELLEAIVGRLPESPLLILALHRPEFEPIPSPPGTGSCIQLGPLSAESTADMLRHVLGGEAPDRLRALVLEKTQGNPLYVEEVVHTLLAAGQLARNPRTGRYELSADSAAVDLPATLQGLVLARVDRLPEEHRRILQVSSVFGRAFPRDALRSVLPFPLTAEGLHSRLDEMSRLELLIPETPAAVSRWTGGYAFRHALIQEAVYESLSYARRREIHRAIGEELDEAGPDRVEENCDLLARHFDLARVPEKAFTYLALAGDRARRAYANAEAADCYRRALPHARALPGLDPTRLAGLLEHLGEVLSLTGEYAAAVERYGEALQHTASPVDRARLEGKIGGVFYRQGQPQTGIEHLERGLSHLGIRMPATRWQVRASLVRQVVTQAAHTWFPRVFIRERSDKGAAARAAIEIYEALSRIRFESDLDRTLDAHLRQLNLCETLHDSPEMAQTYSSHGIVCGTIPLFRRALRYQRAGLAIREARGDRWGVAQSSNFMGIAWYWMARWDEARACLEHSARIFDEVGDRWESEVTYLILSYVALRQGELEQAARHARTSLDLSRRADDSQGMGWALGALAEVRCRQGRLEQALACARQALACSQHARDGMYVAVVRRILGAIYLKSGDARRAAVELEGSVRQIHEERLRHEYVLGAYAGLAEARLACLAAGSPEPRPTARQLPPRQQSLREIRRLCRTAVRKARKFRNWLPEAYRVSALWAWAAGRPRTAERFFERSLQAAHSLGARYELALTWYEAGRFLAASGRPQAGECLAEAARLFEACGAIPDRDRAATAAAALPVRIEASHPRALEPHLLPGRISRRRMFSRAIFRRG